MRRYLEEEGLALDWTGVLRDWITRADAARCPETIYCVKLTGDMIRGAEFVPP